MELKEESKKLRNISLAGNMEIKKNKYNENPYFSIENKFKMDQTKTLKKLPKTLRDISFRLEERENKKVDYDIGSKMGIFNYNNGMLAYVDGIKNLYCVPFRFSLNDVEDGMTLELSDRIESIYGKDGQNISQMLRDSGYQNESIWVPHSNDGGAWGSKIFKDAKVIARIERQLEMEKFYDRIGVKPQLDVPEELADIFKPAWEGFDDFGYLVKNVGKFDSNNGVVTFVDKYAIPHVAPAEKELFKKLEEVGFEKGVFVPHSNDGGAWLNHMFPNLCYDVFLEKIKTGNPSFDVFVEAVSNEMQAYDAIDPYKKDALKSITDKADSFLRRNAGISYENFLKQANPDEFTGNDYGNLPQKKNLKRRLFEHRARLYLSALEDYEQKGHSLDDLLSEIEQSTIPYLKKEKDEPTFQEIIKILEYKS